MKMLSSSSKLAKAGNNIILQGSFGQETMRLKLSSALETILSTTTVNQAVDLSQPSLLLNLAQVQEFKINGNINTIFYGNIFGSELVLQGCNIHKITYYASKNGAISFTVVKSTARKCLNDYDHLIFQALSKITNFVQNNGIGVPSFEFYEGSGIFKNLVASFVPNQEIPTNFLLIGVTADPNFFRPQNNLVSLQGSFTITPKYVNVILTSQKLYISSLSQSNHYFNYNLLIENNISFADQNIVPLDLSASDRILRNLILSSVRYSITLDSNI